MYCSICKNMIFELMYAAIGTNTGLSELFPKAKRFAVWFGKCTRQKGFIGQQKVQRRKEDYWKIAFQNQREIRQNGRIKYSMNGKWQGKQRCYSLESCSFTLGMAKIQRWTQILSVTCPLSRWICGLRSSYKRFAKETGKDVGGEHFTVWYGVYVCYRV